MDFLRASNYYSLERAYKICVSRDLVPEMVFLLGRMGDNKRALNLIIERLGDVERVRDTLSAECEVELTGSSCRPSSSPRSRTTTTSGKTCSGTRRISLVRNTSSMRALV